VVQIKEVAPYQQATGADIFPEALMFKENAIRYFAC
tara:strand:- start:1378 stop:1485 length:108 start_codon:yes stop_codon:yes gene_type:complete